jgi:hypothetical protein
MRRRWASGRQGMEPGTGWLPLKVASSPLETLLTRAHFLVSASTSPISSASPEAPPPPVFALGEASFAGSLPGLQVSVANVVAASAA